LPALAPQVFLSRDAMSLGFRLRSLFFGWQKQAGEASEGGRVPGQLCNGESIRLELLDESTKRAFGKSFQPLTTIFLLRFLPALRVVGLKIQTHKYFPLLSLAVRQSQTIKCSVTGTSPTCYGSPHNLTHKVNQIRLGQPSTVTPTPVNYHNCEFQTSHVA